MSSSPATAEERIRVACAIGNFLLAFNQIDMLTHRAISVLCDEPMLWGIATREWEFERRRALVVKLLEKRVAPTQLTDEWQREWGRVQTLADHRSHIAHGQMSGTGFLNPRTEAFQAFQPIYPALPQHQFPGSQFQAKG